MSASLRWFALQHQLHYYSGHFRPEYPGQFAAEWVVSLSRNGMVTFIRISKQMLG
jgi:hypothetical protein